MNKLGMHQLIEQRLVLVLVALPMLAEMLPLFVSSGVSKVVAVSGGSSHCNNYRCCITGAS